MRSDDISQDIRTKKPSGDRDIGMRQGVILAWNDLTGENLVDVEGEAFQNLDVLVTGIGISYALNDVVNIVRRQSRYFINGKVGAVNGSAGSGIQEAVFGYSDTVASTAGGWVDVPSGVVSIQAYIGSSSKAMVVWRADVSCNNSTGEVSWAVSGATNVTVASRAGMSMVMDAATTGTPSTAVKETLCGLYTLRGLNQGLHTFTMKYRVAVHVSGINVVFGSPQITIIPL